METKLKKAKLTLGTSNQLTRVPRGYEDIKGSPVEGALRLKGLIVEEPLSEAVVTIPKLVDSIVKFAQRARPVLDFGWDAIGARAPEAPSCSDIPYAARRPRVPVFLSSAFELDPLVDPDFV